MSPLLEATETDHILSFKTLIDNLRKIAGTAFVSVREKKLSQLLDDCKVNINFRGPVLDYLKDNGLLIVQGERALMRYKFVEQQLKIDTLTQANKAYNAISTKVKPQKYRFKKFIVPEEVVDNRISSITKKEFSLKDTVLFLKDNKILQGQIIGLRFVSSTIDEESDDIRIDFSSIQADVIITSMIHEKGTIVMGLRKEDIFSSLETLFSVQKVKYNNSISTIKTE